MNIALVCPDDLSVVLFCKTLVFKLQNNGKNTVYVICDFFKATDNFGYIDEIEKWGAKHIHVKLYRFYNPIKDLIYSVELYNVFRSRKIDMVINVTTKPNIYGTFAAYFANVKKILCGNWGFGITISRDKTIRDKILKKAFIFLYKTSFLLSTKVWFTNENDAHSDWVSKSLCNNKLILTKNYVDTTDYSMESIKLESLESLRNELQIKLSTKTVVMVSRMSWSKGVREFIEASNILLPELPDVKFLLIGPTDEGSPDSVPEKYILDNEGKNPNFLWLGFRNDVKNLYALSDIAVYPTFYREGGYPRGITEPMSMGKPVIATNNIHCKKTIDEGKNGLIVPIKDSAALANAIKKILTNKIVMKNYGVHSRQKAVSEFDEEKIVSNVVKQVLVQ